MIINFWYILRRMQPIYSLDNHGRTIGWSYQQIWRGNFIIVVIIRNTIIIKYQQQIFVNGHHHHEHNCQQYYIICKYEKNYKSSLLIILTIDCMINSHGRKDELLPLTLIILMLNDRDIVLFGSQILS